MSHRLRLSSIFDQAGLRQPGEALRKRWLHSIPRISYLLKGFKAPKFVGFGLVLVGVLVLLTVLVLVSFLVLILVLALVVVLALVS